VLRQRVAEGLEVSLSANGRNVTVAEFTTFRYDEVFPPALFSLQLPADVSMFTGPEGMKPLATSLNGPKETAAYFFDALAHENWDQVLEVYPETRVSDDVKKAVGGIQVISLGEPFRSGLYPGYFVPYQIRMRDGSLKSGNLAVRNDNPAHRWMFDGGL
jgi:hypothetical protein